MWCFLLAYRRLTTSDHDTKLVKTLSIVAPGLSSRTLRGRRLHDPGHCDSRFSPPERATLEKTASRRGKIHRRPKPLPHNDPLKQERTYRPNRRPTRQQEHGNLRPRTLCHITPPFTRPRRTTLISESARPAAPSATDCYLAIHGTTFVTPSTVNVSWLK